MVANNKGLEKILGSELITVEGLFVETSIKEKYLYADIINFQFQSHTLILKPIIDLDEIEINIKKKCASAQSNADTHFEKYVGKKLGYTWICINTRGYFDVFLLSFTNLIPQIMIISEGSTLKIRHI